MGGETRTDVSVWETRDEVELEQTSAIGRNHLYISYRKDCGPSVRQ